MRIFKKTKWIDTDTMKVRFGIMTRTNDEGSKYCNLSVNGKPLLFDTSKEADNFIKMNKNKGEEIALDISDHFTKSN